MYLNKKKHILSNTLMLVAVLNLMAEGMNAIIRLWISQTMGNVSTPAMLNEAIWNAQNRISFLHVLITALLFLIAKLRLNRYRKLIPKEDEEEMARLQMEMNPEGVSVLTIKSLEQLTSIWSIILVGVGIVYEITSTAYRSFVNQLTGLIDLNDYDAYMSYVAIYNSTHGFKYLGMIIAICIGIFTTGIFLKDKFLEIVAMLYTCCFVVAFLTLNHSTFVLGNLSVGIVWTSVIFHALQSIGLFSVAFYLKHKFRGM